jgi:hypothetical protein
MRHFAARRMRKLALATLCLFGCSWNTSPGAAPDAEPEEEYFQGPTGYEDNPVGGDYVKVFKKVAIEKNQLDRMTVLIEDAEGAVLHTKLSNGTFTLRNYVDKSFNLAIFLSGEIATDSKTKTNFWVLFAIPFYFEPETTCPWEWVYNYEHLYSEWWNLKLSISATVATIYRDTYDSQGLPNGHDALFPLPPMVDPLTTSLTGHFVLEKGTLVSKSELHVEASADVVMVDNMGTKMRVILETAPEARDGR